MIIDKVFELCDQGLMVHDSTLFNARAELASLRSDLAVAILERDVARAENDLLMKFDSPSGSDALDRLLHACEIGDGIDQHCAPDLQAVKDELAAAQKRGDQYRRRALALLKLARENLEIYNHIIELL